MSNIFLGNSTCATCVRAIYSLLNDNDKEWVNTSDILERINREDLPIKSLDKAIKKAKKLIRDELNARGLDFLEKIEETDNRIKCFALPKGINDPLRDLVRIASVRNGLDMHKALKIQYTPGYRAPEEHIFHPQYARIYNNREFVFGIYEGEETNLEYVVLPMDRIVSAEIYEGSKYQHRDEKYYIDKLKNVVGVSIDPNDTTIYEVIIKTFDIKTHMRIVTKPIHWSQKEIQRYAENKTDGEIHLSVQLNNELRAVLLSFGNAIEVVEPAPLREKIQKVAFGMNKRYNN